jgi:aminoglycoside phosphotransferase (APT) family kinase protein
VRAGPGRDLDELRPRLEGWLARWCGASVSVHDLRAATSGWSNETILVHFTSLGSPDVMRRVVVRMAGAAVTFPDDDLAVQGEVQRAVHRLGVPAPAPVTVEADGAWMGAPFLVMPFVDGHVPGEVPALDPWITESSAVEQAALMDAFVDTLAAVHRVDWRAAQLGSVLRGEDGALERELDWWVRYVDWSCEGERLAALDEGLQWCRTNQPAEVPAPSLLWGDPRLGNLVVGEDRRVRAVLDWDMASIGPAEMDLGWALVLQWCGEVLLERKVAGFPGHDDVVARYERTLGRPVRDLDWYEVFALVRSLAVSNRQARVARSRDTRYAMAADDRNPLVGLLRLRMAEHGPER